MIALQKNISQKDKKHKLQMKEWKKIFHAIGNQKRAKMIIIKSEKIDFKSKLVSWDQKKNVILMVKGLIQQEDKKF